MHAYAIESNTKHKSPALAQAAQKCSEQHRENADSCLPISEPLEGVQYCAAISKLLVFLLLWRRRSHLQVFACVSVLALPPCQGSRHQKMPVHMREIQYCKCEELANSETLVYGVKASFLPLQMEETEPTCVWHAVQNIN
jgi:hypothetical protein